MDRAPLKVQVTYQQIANFRNHARTFLTQKTERTKLHYALERVLKSTERHHQDFADKEQEIRIDLASTDKDGNLLTDKDTGYSYTKPNAKELSTKVRALSLTNVEVDGYIATELPTKLEPIWYEFFVPFVIEDKEV